MERRKVPKNGASIGEFSTKEERKRKKNIKKRKSSNEKQENLIGNEEFLSSFSNPPAVCR